VCHLLVGCPSTDLAGGLDTQTKLWGMVADLTCLKAYTAQLVASTDLRIYCWTLRSSWWFKWSFSWICRLHAIIDSSKHLCLMKLGGGWIYPSPLLDSSDKSFRQVYCEPVSDHSAYIVSRHTPVPTLHPITICCFDWLLVRLQLKRGSNFTNFIGMSK
jgi:hypothetical protein